MTETQLIKCLIVDDEALARELIQTHLEQIPGYELVASCASAIEASDVLKKKSIDLMFLDIEMPVLKGTEFYKNLVHKPRVIFTTAYRDYALDGFELDAVDYLLKPVVFSRFFQAIERFASHYHLATNSTEPTTPQPPTPTQRPDNNGDYIFVRKDRKQVKIRLDEIAYVQSLKDYVKIFIDNPSSIKKTLSSHMVKLRISELEQELGAGFARVHRSYIVNTSKVTAYSKHDVEIGEHEIPIGDNYRGQLERLFES